MTADKGGERRDCEEERGVRIVCPVVKPVASRLSLLIFKL